MSSVPPVVPPPKTEAQKVGDALEAAVAKAKAAEASSVTYVKTHWAVVGAVLCLIIGFIAGRMV
jgi:hypothetical protein